MIPETILDLLHEVGKLAEREGEQWRLEHAELMDAYAASLTWMVKNDPVGLSSIMDFQSGL